jgi:hypothetical protein
MLIHFHRQAMATFGATGFQHLSPIGRFHTRTKAVDAQAAADFGLISTLGHLSYYLTKIRLRQLHHELLAINAWRALVTDEE